MFTTVRRSRADGVRGVEQPQDARVRAADGTVRLWEAAGGQPVATLEGHTRWVSAVAFSPDGQRLASASWDGTVRPWDAAGGQPVATLEGHTGPVRAVAFSPDGQRLASASDDGTVRLWDPRHSAAISLLNVAAPVAALAWSLSGIGIGAHTRSSS